MAESLPFEISFHDLGRYGSALTSEALIVLTAGTDPEWFDGVSPATGWVIEWMVSSTKLPDAVGDLVRSSLWRGYRLGRLAMGAPFHPDLANPEVTDLIAKTTFLLVTELMQREAVDDIPSEVSRAVVALAERSASAGTPTAAPPASSTSANLDESNVTYAAILITTGIAVALAESATHADDRWRDAD